MKKLALKILAAAMVAVLVLGTGAWTQSNVAYAHGKTADHQDKGKDVKTANLPVKTATLSVADGAVVNSTVTITVTQGSGTVRLNNKKLRDTTTVKADGTYKVTVKDTQGQIVSTQSFTIDRKKPEIKVKAARRCYQLRRNGGFATADVKVTVKDKTTVTTTVTKDGQSIPFATGIFTAEGQYTVTSVDQAGNTATATFTIDLTNPVITVTDSTGAAVANKATVTGPIKVVATDLYLNKVKVQKLHGDDEDKDDDQGEWKKGTPPADGTLSAAGTYLITATDFSGRKTMFVVTIQAAAPAATTAQ